MEDQPQVAQQALPPQAPLAQQVPQPQVRQLNGEEQKTLVHANIIGGHAEAVKQLLVGAADEAAMQVHVDALLDTAKSLKAHVDGVGASEGVPADVHPDWVGDVDQVTHALAAKVEDAAKQAKKSIVDSHPAEVVEAHVKAAVAAVSALEAHVFAPAPAAPKSKEWWLAVSAGAVAVLFGIALIVQHLKDLVY